MTFSANLWPFCDLFSNYERQKGHNSAIMNDIVNDKKGHNFVNDKKVTILWTTKRSQFCERQKGSQFCERQKGSQFCERQKGHNFVNDKKVTFCEPQKGSQFCEQQKGHNFMNDKKVTILWMTSLVYPDKIFLLVYREFFAWFGRNMGKVVAPFATFAKQEVLPCWIFIWKVDLKR